MTSQPVTGSSEVSSPVGGGGNLDIETILERESSSLIEPAENIKVVVRCRPISSKEQEKMCKVIVEMDTSANTVTVSPPDKLSADHHPKTFSFDHVFPAQSTQADVYNAVARPIVQNVLEGYNGTIFAYGQTGTGKTFTMEGLNDEPELKGIIPNSFAQIFSSIAKAEEGQRFLVRCSYLEIYNENIRDLLSKDQAHFLELKEKDKEVYVKDLTNVVVRDANDMDRVMNMGNKNRSVASTQMNQVSSRSHAIFSIVVECSSDGGPSKGSLRMGKLNLVDLAGSERLSKTHATGDRLKEATKINLSLSNLGNVISALVDGSSYIPYRNSKLTRLLQDSLGGNSKTVMVATIGPTDFNADETLSTLRYANRAKNIKNCAKINEDPKDAIIRKYQEEIVRLTALLEQKKIEMIEKSKLNTRDSSQTTNKATKKKILTVLNSAMLDSKKQCKELFRRILSLEGQIQKSQVTTEELKFREKELAEQSLREATLRKTLEQKQLTSNELKGELTKLQHQIEGKQKRITKFRCEVGEHKEKMQMLQGDHRENVKQLHILKKELTRELKLKKLIVDNFIPRKVRMKIEERIRYDDVADKYILASRTDTTFDQPPVNRMLVNPYLNLTRFPRLPKQNNVYYSNENLLAVEPECPVPRSQELVLEEEDPAITNLIAETMRELNQELVIVCDHRKGRHKANF